MERKSLLCLALFVTGCLNAPQPGAPAVGEQLEAGRRDNDHEAVVEVTQFVRDYLALDVQANRNFAETSSKETGNIANTIIQYVNDLNEGTNKFVSETLESLQTSISENLTKIIDNTRKNHEKLEAQSTANEEKISNAATKNFEELLTKMEARLAQHERMLGTNVAVCATQHRYDTGGHSDGAVTYQTLEMAEITTVGGETKNAALDIGKGEFTVPEGADGTYQFSFTAIIDTLRDTDNTLFPASFVLKKTSAGNEVFHPIASTFLIATVGQKGGDKVPASRSILLDLKAGQKVAVFQTREKAESSYRLTFCVHLTRPAAPAHWEALPKPVKAEIEDETIYTEPKPVTFPPVGLPADDLGSSPVTMPDPASELRFPETDFFKRTSKGSARSPIVSTPDPNNIDP